MIGYIVVWFPERKFGFIAPEEKVEGLGFKPDGRPADLFVHGSDVIADASLFERGTVVEFDLGRYRDKPKAIHVRIPNEDPLQAAASELLGGRVSPNGGTKQ